MTITANTEAYLTDISKTMVSSFEDNLSLLEQDAKDVNGTITRVQCVAKYLFEKADGDRYIATVPFNINSPNKPLKDYAIKAADELKKEFTKEYKPLHFTEFIVRGTYTFTENGSNFTRTVTYTATLS